MDREAVLFFSRAVPFLIVLAGLAIQPAVQAQPVVSTIAVTSPGWVAGMVADPIRSRVYVDGNFLYVPVARQFSQTTGKQTILPASENQVVLINTKTKKIVQTFTVGQEPIQVTAAANGVYGYSSNHADGTVTVFNLAHLQPGSF